MSRISKVIKTLLGAGLTLVLIFGFSAHAGAQALKRGDILIADDGGAIIRVDPTTGAQTVISSGVNLVGPTGLAMDRAGDILVADVGAGAVIRVNPATGGQTVISSGGSFVGPVGIAVVTKVPKKLSSVEVEFRLPYPAGDSYTVSQGNNADTDGDQQPDAGGNHSGRSEFAFDFAMPEESDVAASTSGSVVRVESTFENPPPVSCKEKKRFKDQANYVLLKYPDGTRTLYLHLCPNCVFVAPGDPSSKVRLSPKAARPVGSVVPTFTLRDKYTVQIMCCT